MISRIILLVLTSFLMFSCATTTSVLNELEPGMHVSEVKKILGSPDSTSFKNGAYVMKYDLLKPFSGKQPWYLVFNPKTKRLNSWFLNKSELNRYKAEQAEWNRAAASISEQINKAAGQ